MRGLEHGEWATIFTVRAVVEARSWSPAARRLRLAGPGDALGWAPYHWGSEGIVTGDSANDLLQWRSTPMCTFRSTKGSTCDIRPGRWPRGRGASASSRLRSAFRRRRRPLMPRTATYGDDAPPTGFFTDTSICIGCKACEVACKEWNELPRSIDRRLPASRTTTRSRSSANTWRHVAFIEQRLPATVDGRASLVRGPRPGRSQRNAESPLQEESVPLADGLRRLQALHPRGLPRGLPDRIAVSHRVRDGRRPAGHLQRLRLLHPGLPIRRAWISARTTAVCGSARSVTTG